jgi:SH3 domain-containing YSC84-like protein 1
MNKLIGFILVAGLSISARASDTSDRGKLDQRLASSQRVLDEIMSSRDRAIPDAIAARAKCVAVVPGVVKGAIGFGAEYGQGVATCRTAEGWSGPVFIRLAGGSFGFQIGAMGTDLVLVAVNQKGMQDLLSTKFKIGGSAAAAAGPVGRQAAAATDISMRAELLTWSRSRGIFAGVDLNGVSVSQNAVDTNTLYGTFHNFDTILNGHVAPPASTVSFLHTVQEYFGQAKEGREQRKENEKRDKEQEEKEELEH